MIYTTQRCRFVYDRPDNGSRLDGVMVVCTLSITHCLRLNLQLHTIDLVRTCRISSFCTVAWQLARFQLTRRIARSLGDSWASCFIFDCGWPVLSLCWLCNFLLLLLTSSTTIWVTVRVLHFWRKSYPWIRDPRTHRPALATPTVKRLRVFLLKYFSFIHNAICYCSSTVFSLSAVRWCG